jgi:hypothetical protein
MTMATENSRKTNTVLVNLALANAENKTGYIDYNKYGIKDNKGLMSCGPKFVDNFVLMCYVPDYHITNGQFIDVGVMNTSIRTTLRSAGLMNCHVKAVGNLHKTPKPNNLNTVVRRCIEKETADTKYFKQEFKVATANLFYEDVMNYLRVGSYKTFNLFLNDVDVTMDYCGSFDTEELTDHLLINEEEGRFCLQDSEDTDAECTILLNSHKVGYNCLTWIETVGGLKLRYKIYNKFVQMLESEAVRKNIGNHWQTWVEQFNTTLAEARDDGTNRGLTRTEVTFYCQNRIPSDDFIDEKIRSVAGSVPNEIVFSTPYHLAWKAYCETFSHSLVIVDKVSPHQRGLVVYSVNEVTGKVSGKLVEFWDKRGDYSLANITLSENLPLDIITIENTDKDTNEQHRYKVTGTRYIKENTDGVPFKTRLVYKSVYEKCRTHIDEQYMADNQVKERGLHANSAIIPFLSTKKANSKSLVPLKLHLIEEFEVKGIPTKKRKRVSQEMKSSMMSSPPNSTRKIDRRKRFEDAKLEIVGLQRRRTNIKELYTMYSQKNMHVKLSDLKERSYNVTALRAIKRKYGHKYKMLLERNGQHFISQSNFDIEECIHRVLPRKIQENFRNNQIIYHEYSPVGTLTIKGCKKNARKEVIPDCAFVFTNPMKEFAGITETEEDDEDTSNPQTEQIATTIPIISEPQLRKYNSFPDLSDLPIGSYHTVREKGVIHFNRAKRLVVKLEDGKLYKGGENLLQYEEQLKDGTRFYIQKYMKSRSQRGVKFAVCQIVEEECPEGDDEAMEGC